MSDRIEITALEVLEALIEATYTKDRSLTAGKSVSLPLAKQPHFHEELDCAPIISDACNANTRAEPASVLPLSYAR